MIWSEIEYNFSVEEVLRSLKDFFLFHFGKSSNNFLQHRKFDEGNLFAVFPLLEFLHIRGPNNISSLKSYTLAFPWSIREYFFLNDIIILTVSINLMSFSKITKYKSRSLYNCKFLTYYTRQIKYVVGRFIKFLIKDT